MSKNKLCCSKCDKEWDNSIPLFVIIKHYKNKHHINLTLDLI